jgi:hypothetical protein
MIYPKSIGGWYHAAVGLRVDAFAAAALAPNWPCSCSLPPALRWDMHRHGKWQTTPGRRTPACPTSCGCSPSRSRRSRACRCRRYISSCRRHGYQLHQPRRGARWRQPRRSRPDLVSVRSQSSRIPVPLHETSADAVSVAFLGQGCAVQQLAGLVHTQLFHLGAHVLFAIF